MRRRHYSKRKSNRYIGKVAWCDGNVLNLSNGHYVFVRSVQGNKCSVNTFTSLKNNSGSFKVPKFDKVVKGEIYPIPLKDLTLPRFSGIHKGAKKVSLLDLKGVGKHRLKQRHHHYIRKYMK